MIHRKMKMVTVFWARKCFTPLEVRRTVTAAPNRVICRFVRTRSPEE